MTYAKFFAVLVAGVGSAFAAAVPQASAASPVTDAFLANVRPNIEFLDRSSRIAADHSQSAPLRKYALGTVAEATRVASADAMMATGRSASVDAGQRPAGFGQAANGRAPIGRGDLETLAKLSGNAFDDLYWEKQLDALSQLDADYTAYIAAGDDKALVAMAKRELPRVEERLKALSAI